MTVIGDLVGISDFEIAGGGFDADDVVALFPAMYRKDRASAERNDSDAGVGEAGREAGDVLGLVLHDGGRPDGIASAASPTRTVTVRQGFVDDRRAAHPFCDHAVNFVQGCAVVDGPPKDTLDRAFQIGIIAKGLNGLADSESGGNRRPIGLSRVSVTSHPPVSPRAMGPNMTGRGQTWKAGIVLTAHALRAQRRSFSSPAMVRPRGGLGAVCAVSDGGRGEGLPPAVNA